ncbi:unnamed protein product [Chironomus riparius]|uniref:Uncharacterized protein n=1 Tax=Chironomus riparius TaxID=315576 RepID=A0A9N9RYA4_9DIPT|nr:unnamed protein product [Chironomus riparius]
MTRLNVKSPEFHSSSVKTPEPQNSNMNVFEIEKSNVKSTEFHSSSVKTPEPQNLNVKVFENNKTQCEVV